MHVHAPAKLNLFLEVLAREQHGYHQLETLFCALELGDELEVTRTSAPGVTLAVEGDAPAGSENLVHRAATQYLAARDRDGGVHVQLKKHIPSGGGLGGGSSDAAATLRALDRLHDAPLGSERLLQLAAELGSDVPFFLCGSPLALAWGRGGRLLPLEPLRPAHVLLLVPPQGVSTAAAFAALAAARTTERVPTARVLRPDRICDWDDVARLARNDFEPVIFEKMPELGAGKQLLLEHGARLALLTGSGSTVYGIFSEHGALESAAAAAAAAQPDWRVVRTRTAALPAPLPFG